MADARDYKLDISGVSDQAQPAGRHEPRPHLRVRFACCNTYVHAYRSLDGKHYRCGCPRCGKTVRFEVGAGGTDARDFVVE